MANQATEHLEARAAAEAAMAPQSVPVNMYEASEALVIVAPLPAVMADDVHVELRPDAVRFWSRLRTAPARDYLLNEWEYGGYEREVALPPGYGAGVEATLTNGQLAIRVLRGSPVGVVAVQPKSR